MTANAEFYFQRSSSASAVIDIARLANGYRISCNSGRDLYSQYAQMVTVKRAP